METHVKSTNTVNKCSYVTSCNYSVSFIPLKKKRVPSTSSPNKSVCVCVCYIKTNDIELYYILSTSCLPYKQSCCSILSIGGSVTAFVLIKEVFFKSNQLNPKRNFKK